MARSTTATLGQRLTHAAAVVTAEPFTMACWIRPTALAANYAWMSIAASGNNDDSVALQSDIAGVISFRKGNSGGSGTASAGTLTTGAWQHICGSTSGVASRSCYRNGGNKGTNATSITFGGAVDRTGLLHSARNSQDAVCNGAIADAAIWNIVLTDDDVATLAKGVSPRLVRPDRLVAYWPVIGNLSPEPDRWKNRFDLTIAGAVAKADHPRLYGGGA